MVDEEALLLLNDRGRRFVDVSKRLGPDFQEEFMGRGSAVGDYDNDGDLDILWVLGALGRMPRVKPTTKGEGTERRYFYGTVWAMCNAQPILWLLWAALPRTWTADLVRLTVFVGVLALVGHLAYRGKLPRTRPIVPGEWAVSD